MKADEGKSMGVRVSESSIKKKRNRYDGVGKKKQELQAK